VLFLFVVPVPQAEARSRSDPNSLLRKKEKRINELEKRLRKPYGQDAWFAFTSTIVQPHLSGGVTIGRVRCRQRSYAQLRAGRRLAFRSCKVQGTRAAAELIWQAKQTSLLVQFSYRVFKNEKQAEAFLKLMSP
jgi:hypothetical protein